MVKRTTPINAAALEELRARNEELEKTIRRMVLKSQEREKRLLEVNDLRARIEKLESESERDQLTGIYNKKGFCNRYGRFLSQLENFDRYKTARHQRDTARPSGVFVLLDLDCFKCVNDLISMEKGDTLLQMCASFLLERVQRQPGDLVARLQGDEFLLLFRGHSDPKKIVRILDNEIRPKLRSFVPPEVDMGMYTNATDLSYLVDASYGYVVVNSPQLQFETVHALAADKLKAMRAKENHKDSRAILSNIGKK